MKPEDMDLVLQQQSPAAVAQFFKEVSESDRKLLLPRVQEWQKVVEAFVLGSSPMFPFAFMDGKPQKRFVVAKETMEKFKSGQTGLPKAAGDVKSRPAVVLALMACAGLTDVRKIDVSEMDLAMAVMLDRRPKWFDKWLAHLCAESPALAWERVRRIELEGIADAEHDSSYWTSMALTLGCLSEDALYERLKAETAICDELIWNMLDCDEAMNALLRQSLEDDDRRRRGVEFVAWDQIRARFGDVSTRAAAAKNWLAALSRLGRDSLIDRSRLLALILRSLSRISSDGESKKSLAYFPESMSPAQWFIFLHEQIVPTEEERIAEKYVGLLSTKDPTTLSWALETLSGMPPGKWDARNVVANLSNVFISKKKDPALTAIKLLKRIAAEDPAFSVRCAEAVLDALEHSSVDVHKKALDYLQKSGTLENEDVSRQLRERAELLSGLTKQRALQLSGAGSAGDDTAETEAAASCGVAVVEDFAAERDELLARASEVGEALASAAGVKPAIVCVEQISQLMAGEANSVSSEQISLAWSLAKQGLHLTDSCVRRLNPDKKIQPVDNLDDLIYLFLHVLEGKPTVDDVERLMDGLARLCDQRPADFDKRTSSLEKQIGKLLDFPEDSMGPRVVEFGTTYIHDVALVGRSWLRATATKSGGLGGFVVSALKDLSRMMTDQVALMSTDRRLMFFAHRAQALAKSVNQMSALPLLASPTHQGGWIDPRVIAERLRRWQQAKQVPNKADFIQCLLRLAPEFRDEVRAALSSRDDDEYGCALRFALGGELRGAVKTAEIWVAALRCRDPYGTSDALSAKFNGLGPDCLVPAEYDEGINGLQHNESMYTAMFVFNREPKHRFLAPRPACVARSSQSYFPTELLHLPHIAFGTEAPLEQMWPQNRESFFAYQARKVENGLESIGTYWQDSWESAFDSDTRLNGTARWVLALGLSAKQPELARLSLDALIAGVEDCRMDGVSFGVIMGKLMNTERITMVRWLRALKDMARVSPLHTQFVFDAMHIALRGIPGVKSTAPSPAFLELLYDVAASCGEKITDEMALESLRGIGGKGKGAKLAKSLLDAKAPSPFSPHRCAVVMQILRARVERAERWKQWMDAAISEPVGERSVSEVT